MDRELLRGSIPIFILSLLAEAPMYGYQINERVRARSRGLFELSEGTVYNALRRLEKQQLIQSFWQTQPNGRERHYYELLPKGKALLQSKLDEWRRFTSVLESFLQQGEAPETEATATPLHESRVPASAPSEVRTVGLRNLPPAKMN